MAWFKEKLEFSISFAKRSGVFQAGTIEITKPKDPKLAEAIDDVVTGALQQIELDHKLTLKRSPKTESGRSMEVMVAVIFPDNVDEMERDAALAAAFAPMRTMMRDLLADGGKRIKEALM